MDTSVELYSYKGLFHTLTVTLNKKAGQGTLMLKISFIIGYKLILDFSPTEAQGLLIKNIIKGKDEFFVCYSAI